MTTHKPNRSDEWNDLYDLDFDHNSNSYSDFEESAIEALTVHLGNEHYFESYAE